MMISSTLFIDLNSRSSCMLMMLCLIIAYACDDVPTSNRATPTLIPRLLYSLPSDSSISTQCLTFDQRGSLWFTSGGYGTSELLRYDSDISIDARQTDQIQWTRWAIKDHFAEGCAEINQHIVVLTWRARLAFIFDLRTLAFDRTLTLFTEGWGLASSSHGLIYSDGSSSLRWLKAPRIKDGTQLEVLRDVTVRDQGVEVYQLNELEWFDGYLLANIYPQDKIAVIEPESGHVKAWLNLSGLRHHESITARELNGIAYHDMSDTLLVTGKGWGRLYVLDSGWLRKMLSMI